MTVAAALHADDRLWNEELASRPDRARIRARIGVPHCSLCTGTIQKSLGSNPRADKVAVSLTHQRALSGTTRKSRGRKFPPSEEEREPYLTGLAASIAA
ncbi:MAG: hypothetical protein ACT4P8_05580 [Betaproteobacteria bacterium]